MISECICLQEAGIGVFKIRERNLSRKEEECK